MFRKYIPIAAVIAAFLIAPVAPAFADDDFGPAAIEDASEPRDVGAEIDDASGPRETVTDENPYGAGAALKNGSGPRKVGAKIDPATAPRPVQK